MNKEEELIDRLIDLAFAEDIGDGDHTTLSCIPATAMGKSKLLIKEAGILAGIEVAKEVFRRFDPTMKVEVFINDGTEVKPGDVAMVVEGKVQSLLQTERLMLNIMQRMSGIATMTHKYAEKLKGTNTRVLDTRKTTPGMRILEKMAVKIGGGVNHRIGLFDMILLKDNHVDFAGGIDKVRIPPSPASISSPCATAWAVTPAAIRHPPSPSGHWPTSSRTTPVATSRRSPA